MVNFAKPHTGTPAMGNVSTFRAQIASALDYVKESGKPFYITRDGGCAGVLLDPDTYDALMFELERRRGIMLGMEQFEEGRSIPAEQLISEMEAEGCE